MALPALRVGYVPGMLSSLQHAFRRMLEDVADFFLRPSQSISQRRSTSLKRSLGLMQHLYRFRPALGIW